VTWPCVAVFFGTVHYRAKWLDRPQLKQLWPEAVLVVGGAGRSITGEVEVEPGLLHAGADAEVGGEPTAATDADTGADVAVEVGT
jgi:hypothetical protein